MDDGGTNALIMPCKKKNKVAVKTQNIVNAQTHKGKEHLTKSQKRKLKKLEDEMEKKHLLSKSLEILDKHKINEDVYKLLCSTWNLGQAETSKEKRRRIMQFSQVGLEVPYADRRTKTKSSDDICSISETTYEAHIPQVYEDKSNVLKPLVVQRESVHTETRLLDSNPEQLYENALEGNKTSATKFSIEELGEEHARPIGVTIGALSSTNSSLCSMKKGSAAVGALTAPIVVPVSRRDGVESKRKNLPIVMMEQEIMEAINENASVIICGETGCGKTTQVPQFLYEAGFGSKLCSMRAGMIGVTQPRRVAVLATAERVAYELDLDEEVGFQVRYDKRIGENCAIKFMTDGILLREVQGDFLLRRYSVIILDEVHERSINTDILIGMLSRVVRKRQDLYEEQQKAELSGKTIDDELRVFPLKLILMSATMRVEDFTVGGRIFHEPPPVINVIAQERHPVTVHYLKRTEIVDYIGAAYKKVISIHKNLPPGGILVFVTGQKEVEDLCSMLRKASKCIAQKNSSKVDGNTVSIGRNSNEIDGYDMKEINDALEVDESKEVGDEESDFSYHTDGSESDLEFEVEADVGDDDLAQVLGQNGNLETLKGAFDALGGKTAATMPEPSQPEKRGENDKLVVGQMRVFRLYGMLPEAEQRCVFGNVKEGERRVVVATNVAETSITIPGIKYIINTGREKVKEFNLSNGIESFKVQFISKASAAQRRGRAGRTGPGHCYCLYSSSFFHREFSEFSIPEISKAPVDGVLLLLKFMGIKVADFPFPTPPDVNSLIEAERCLKNLEALNAEGELTPLGKIMSQFPMRPRHSRVLLAAIQDINKKKHCVRSNLVLGYAVAAAAALSVSNPFIFQLGGNINNNSSDSQEQDEKIRVGRKNLKEALKLSRSKFTNIKSDALTVAHALQCFERSRNRSDFCTNHSLSSQTMYEMSNLRMQLLWLVCQFSSEFLVQDVQDAWKAPCEKNPLSLVEEDLLLGAICAGWIDRVAKRIKSSEGGKIVNNAVPYQAVKERLVYLHCGSSVLKSAPKFIFYNDLLVHGKRGAYIHSASSVQPEWLVKYGASQCRFSEPLTYSYDPLADQVYSHVIPYFGPHSWQLLPYYKMAIDDVEDRVKVFAYTLLDGQVLPCLRSARRFRAAKPSIILKKESLGEKRVGNLLSVLSRRSRVIHSCAMLRKAWEEDSNELYEEIRCWFQAGFHRDFNKLWNDMQQEAFVITTQKEDKET